MQIAEQFHDLNQDISTCLDVLSLKDLDLSDDVQEQISLLKVQSWRSKLYLDPKEESLRKQIYAFVDDFNSGRTPDLTEIHSLFVDGLQISDAMAFRKEIDFLEGQICRREEDIDEIDLSLIHSVVALSRFARFSLRSLNPEFENLSIQISLDLMAYPVICPPARERERERMTREGERENDERTHEMKRMKRENDERPRENDSGGPREMKRENDERERERE